MEIWFASSKAEKLFSNEKKLKKKFGVRMAGVIMLRLTDLAGCENFKVAFSIPGRLHPLVGDMGGLFAMDLVQPHRLLLSPANKPLPMLDGKEGGIDYQKVDEIEITGVIDYH